MTKPGYGRRRQPDPRIAKMTSNKRILVVDDDSGVREAYQDILSPAAVVDFTTRGAALFGGTPPESKPPEHERYELTLAERGEHGAQAVERSLAEGRPFAVAFVDMKMPGIDGAEASKRIWAVDARIKITIVTAFSEHSPDDIIRVTGRNDVFYLRKPFNPDEIRQFARALSNQWSLERERESLAAQLQRANDELADINRNLKEKVEEQTALLVQSEKMASIGILAAGVAHEINNPISFVNGNLRALKKYGLKIIDLFSKYRRLEDCIVSGTVSNLSSIIAEIAAFRKAQKIDFVLDDLTALTDESLEGVDRVKTIVQDLKIFSRLDEADFKPIDITESIETTLHMVWNELKYHVAVVKEYGELPLVSCFPQKISQVFMNLLINAAQAIEGQGTIRIVTRHVTKGRRSSDESVEIDIMDTGKGIPPKDLPKIFDPFFTTKPVGQGTGLGLSIVYDIIKAHKGTITVDSRVGEGTAFHLSLPVSPIL